MLNLAFALYHPILTVLRQSYLIYNDENNLKCAPSSFINRIVTIFLEVSNDIVTNLSDDRNRHICKVKSKKCD